MLYITIPETDLYDESRNLFIHIKEKKLSLEHSLVSISKWESKWQKPFLSKKKKTVEETLDYIRCMTITQNVDPNSYLAITPEIVEEIDKYINNSMTATTFSKTKDAPFREVITAEIVYNWMLSLDIPLECEKWHFNKLITLIRVRSIKLGPQKKMSKSEIYAQNRALNEARRRANNSKG